MCNSEQKLWVHTITSMYYYGYYSSLEIDVTILSLFNNPRCCSAMEISFEKGFNKMLVLFMGQLGLSKLRPMTAWRGRNTYRKCRVRQPKKSLPIQNPDSCGDLRKGWNNIKRKLSRFKTSLDRRRRTIVLVLYLRVQKPELQELTADVVENSRRLFVCKIEHKMKMKNNIVDILNPKMTMGWIQRNFVPSI